MKPFKTVITVAVLAAAFAGPAMAQERRGDGGDRGARENGNGNAAQAPRDAGGSEEFAARYGILSEKNIFVRNRPPTRRGAVRSNGSSVRRPEELMVLTGIALQEGRHVAFIENTASRSTQRLVVGDTVLGGKVGAIDFDGLEFESGGRQTRVAVGRNFLGAVAAAAAAAPAPAASGAAPTTSAATAPAGNDAASGAPAGPGPSPDDSGLSAEERMKRNRLRQLGQ